MRLSPFKLERFFAAHEFAARYSLCSSDCESLELRQVLDLEPGAADRFASLWLGYTETLGNPELRQVISSLYDGLSADEVLVLAGAEEGIFNFMSVVLGPGDHLVVQAPCYQSLGEVARGNGAEVSNWRGDPSRDWALDLADLVAQLRANTRVVVVNFPHNPTGFLPSREFLLELSALSDEHGFVVFSDEVYRGLELDPSDRLPSFSEVNPRAVSLGVMSKTYGLPGLRIGWLTTRNRELLDRMASFKDYTTICCSAPSEFLATIALRHARPIVQRNLDIVRENLSHLDRFFDDHPDRFGWYRPKAGSVAFPSLLRGEAEAFCQDLVERTGVLLLPGTLYGPEYGAVRFGFGRKNLPEALDRLAAYLRQHH